MIAIDLDRILNEDSESIANWAISVERDSELGKEISSFWADEEKIKAAAEYSYDISEWIEIRDGDNWPLQVAMWWSALNSMAFKYNTMRMHKLVTFFHGHSGHSFHFMFVNALNALRMDENAQV